jgi:CRP-like cAMP-binding protein
LSKRQREATLASILQYCEDAHQVAFDAGAVLLTEGRKTDRLYVLINGVIEIFRGGVQVALVNEPGAVLGEISALINVPHTATARALTLGPAYELENAKTLLRSRPDTAIFLAELLAHRLNHATAALADHMQQHYPDHPDQLDNIRSTLEGLKLQHVH